MDSQIIIAYASDTAWRIPSTQMRHTYGIAELTGCLCKLAFQKEHCQAGYLSQAIDFATMGRSETVLASVVT